MKVAPTRPSLIPGPFDQVYVSGSVAFDTIMSYDGLFSKAFLQDHLDDINISFLVQHGQRRLGGTAANIAYTLGLLGDHPTILGSVGTDFHGHEHHLQSVGVDCDALHIDQELPTGHCYILTDASGSQLTMFAPGAMSTATAVHLPVLDADHPRSLVIVAPDAPAAMELRIAEARNPGTSLVFSPAQQLPALSDTVLRAGIEAAQVVVGNAYEWHLIEDRLGNGVSAFSPDRWCIITDGARGAHAYHQDEESTIDVAPISTMVDPTGAGDAFLAGLCHGLLGGRPMDDALRFGAVAAAYTLEHLGPQTHHFTMMEFTSRLNAAYSSHSDKV